MIHRLGLLVASLLLACTITPQTTDAAPPTTPAAADTGKPVVDEDPDDAAPAATGTACTTSADCGDGICEGEGCGDKLGKCVPKQRMCTRDLQVYCGCDGVEFRGSGSCPGARFAHRGPCEKASPKPDGSPCNAATECSSGVCEGEGCDKPGVCMAAHRACTKDLREYCGCDGKTFRGSGSCPGARFSQRAACSAP